MTFGKGGRGASQMSNDSADLTGDFGEHVNRFSPIYFANMKIVWHYYLPGRC